MQVKAEYSRLQQLISVACDDFTIKQLVGYMNPKLYHVDYYPVFLSANDGQTKKAVLAWCLYGQKEE